MVYRDVRRPETRTTTKSIFFDVRTRHTHLRAGQTTLNPIFWSGMMPESAPDRKRVTSKTYSLRSRMRLFDGCVTPTVLYGCTSWTLTKDMTTKLQRTQRRMLRLVIGTPRRRNNTTTTTTTTPTTTKHNRNNHDPLDVDEGTTSNDSNDRNDINSDVDSQSTDDVDSTTCDANNLDDLGPTADEDLEPWPDFIKRATRVAEESIQKLGIEEWTVALYKRKWRWANRIASHSSDRWTRLAAEWQPELHDGRPTIRKQARPRRRWEDDITLFLKTASQHEQTDRSPSNNTSANDDIQDGHCSSNSHYDDSNDDNDNLNEKRQTTDSVHDTATRRADDNDRSDAKGGTKSSSSNTYSAHWLELLMHYTEDDFVKFMTQPGMP